MLILLSPAKTLDYDKPVPVIPESQPRLAEDARALATAAAKLGPARLCRIMHISDTLAKLNADRFRSFDAAPERAAIFAFAGDVYRGLRARTLSSAALGFADDHLRILSGLYGLLRPGDLIRPYRLEMGTRWAPGRKRDLLHFWGERIGSLLAQDLTVEGSNEVLNLASQEYFAAITQAPPPGARIVAIDFREIGPDGLRFNSFAAKHARGAMARWACERHADRIEAMKGFDEDGYSFDRDASTDESWRFVRTA